MNGHLLFFFERYFLKKTEKLSNNHRIPHKLFWIEMTVKESLIIGVLKANMLIQNIK